MLAQWKFWATISDTWGQVEIYWNLSPVQVGAILRIACWPGFPFRPRVSQMWQVRRLTDSVHHHKYTKLQVGKQCALYSFKTIQRIKEFLRKFRKSEKFLQNYIIHPFTSFLILKVLAKAAFLNFLTSITEKESNQQWLHNLMLCFYFVSSGPASWLISLTGSEQHLARQSWCGMEKRYTYCATRSPDWTYVLLVKL